MVRLTEETKYMYSIYVQNPNWMCEEVFIRTFFPVGSRRKAIKRATLFRASAPKKALKYVYLNGPRDRVELISLPVLLEGKSAIKLDLERMFKN